MQELKVVDTIGTTKVELSDKEIALNVFLDKRIEEMKKHRKNVFGADIDELMRLADIDLQIKQANPKGKKVLAENELLGLRGTSTFVDLGVENWQSDQSSIDPFVKVMTALSVIFDNNPRAVFEPGGTRYIAVNEIHKQLFEKSWQRNDSKEQLKAFEYYLAKYGWAVGRSYIKQETRNISEIIEYNPDTKEIKEKDKEIQSFAESIRETLDPHRTWLDDKMKANNMDSCNDWIWEKDYGYDRLEAEFSDTKNWKYVPRGGSEKHEIDKVTDKEYQDKEIYTVQFYENYYKDRFIARVKCQGAWIPLVNSPLPYDHKKLSLWTTYWNLRDPRTPYGIGVPEVMRGDKKLRNKVKNMSIDQIVLSIYKMGIMEDTGVWGNRTKLEIKPGRIIKGGKVNWLDVPGPGKDAEFGLQFLKDEMDNATGITPTLEGEISGKTAFEIGQAKESALKRLKIPLDNIVFALNIEAELTIDLIYQAYTIPMVERLVDQDVIDAYKKEVNNNSKFYYEEIDEDGAIEFYAKRYKEIGVKVEEKNGIFVPTGKQKFFYIMPDFIRWRGEIKIIAQSILSTWKEIEKSQKNELAKLIIEILQLGPDLGLKPARQILEVWDENPEKWLPNQWLQIETKGVSPQQEIAQQGAEMLGAENLPQEIKAQLPVEQPQKTGFMSKVGEGINKLFGR